MGDNNQVLLHFKKALNDILANPSATHLNTKALCPHMEPAAAQTALDSNKLVALPATSVLDSYWVVRRNNQGGYTAKACRADASFLTGSPCYHNRLGDARVPGHKQAIGRDEALAYRFAGTTLAPDIAVDTVRFELYWQRANGLTYRKPHVVVTKNVVVYGALRISAATIIGMEDAVERAAAFDDAFVLQNGRPLVTTDAVAGQELVGFSPSQLNYCGICGTTLWANNCAHKSHCHLPQAVLTVLAASGYTYN